MPMKKNNQRSQSNMGLGGIYQRINDKALAHNIVTTTLGSNTTYHSS